jgi:hypothetical protein
MSSPENEAKEGEGRKRAPQPVRHGQKANCPMRGGGEAQTGLLGAQSAPSPIAVPPHQPGNEATVVVAARRAPYRAICAAELTGTDKGRSDGWSRQEGLWIGRRGSHS